MLGLVTPPPNRAIAKALSRLARLLDDQGAPSARVASYREAADAIRDLERPVGVMLANAGRRALAGVPGIDARAAAAIEEYASRQRIGLLDWLEGRLTAEELFSAVPGLSVKRAHLIHETLDIDTLEELELAAHDGRLLCVPGVGANLVAALRTHLGSILTHSARNRARARRVLGNGARPAPDAPVKLLLELDAEYRAKAAGTGLARIAPKRFNARAKSWLPIMHAERDGWDCTLTFSNTARAHRLRKTRDWVVIVYSRNGVERQCTIRTAADADRSKRRVVRGREAQCLAQGLASELIAGKGARGTKKRRSRATGALS